MSGLPLRDRAIHAISYARQEETAWKNGGGKTRELCKVDDERGMLWRASVATIDRSGDFSLFEGCDRIICLLAGKPVTLHFADGEKLGLELLEPRTFSCERPVSASITGESRDFNLIWRRAAVSVVHEVVAVRGTVSSSMPAANWHLIVGCGGSIAVRIDGRSETITPGDAILFDRVDDASPLGVEMSGEEGFAIGFFISDREHGAGQT